MLYTFFDVIGNEDLKKQTGKKAASLIQMLEWGLPVPEGACITLEAFDKFLSLNRIKDLTVKYTGMSCTEERTTYTAEMQETIMNGNLPPTLITKIDEFLEKNSGKSFAIRSSGTGEDLQNASFAGQYTTILNVRNKEDVYNSIKKCWASQFDKHILEYCTKNEIDILSLKMAVIIQEMIPAQKSGVVFTVNPLEGFDRQMVIEACFGLGEALVNGEVTPDRYYYDWYNKKECSRTIGSKDFAFEPEEGPSFIKRVELPAQKRNTAVLSPEEVEELSLLALKTQAHYGFPIDMEWAKHGGKFYILQSRPITRISFGGIEGHWTTANFKDGGVAATVCIPYLWSLYDMIWEATYPEFIKRIGLLDKDRNAVFGSMHFGRPYWNIFEAKESMKKLPGFVERDLDENFGIEVTYEGKGFTSGTNLVSLIRGVKVLNQLKKSFSQQTEFYPVFKETQTKRLSKLDEIEPEKIPEKEFYDFYVKFIREEYFESESAYFYQIYNNTFLQSLFKDYFKKIKKNKNGNSSVLVLMSGIKDIAHLRFNYSLWNVSRLIRGNKEAYRFWAETSSEDLKIFWKQGQNSNFMQEVREILKQFGHHSTNELDISIPRYREEPCIVFDSLKSYINMDEKHNPVRLTEKQYEEYIVEKTKILKHLPVFKRRSFENRVENMRSFLWWHEELRDLSIRYYYHVRRFTLVLADHFMNRGILGTTEDIFFMSIDDIESCIHGRASTEETKDLIKRNRLYYQSFRNFDNPGEIGNCFKTGPRVPKNKVSTLKGTPCSPGIVSGRVKLINDIFDAGRLEKGDILITKYTDPGWTPKFGLINGIATEYGGLLSHAALISREYGIPSVMAVKDLTKLVYDGQEVTIDGNTGEIILHQGGVQNATNTAESRL